jgi:hypothetical protein
MHLIWSLKRFFLYKKNRVTYKGREAHLSCRRFRKSPETPQEYADRNAVICGNCAKLIWPDDEIWLMVPKEKDFQKPGVLIVDVENEKAMVGCLAWSCPPTSGVMCGRLMEDRKIDFFESPIQKALRTGDMVAVPSIQAYRG